MNDQYFITKGFKKIGEGIYVYNNLLSEEEISKLTVVFDNVRNKSLFNKSLDGTTFENRISVPLRQLEIVWEKASAVIGPEFYMPPNESVNVMQEGDDWGQHSDNHDFLEKRKLSLSLKEGEPYEVVKDTRYGVVVYFNKVDEGGDLYYSQQNITYSPNPGDMVVHSAEEECMHGVNKVLRGYRYSYSNFLSIDMKIPVR
jgi:hypothetical protein